MPTTTRVSARQLNQATTGDIVQFNYIFPNTRVRGYITGELRDVTHNEYGTHLMLTGADSLDGEVEEFSINRNEEVVIIKGINKE